MNRKGIVGRVKDFFGGYTVPPMPDINTVYGDGLNHNEYRDKTSQIRANTGWVYLASGTIAERCASVKLHLYRQMKNGDREEVFEHEVLDLLNNPTASMTAKQLWELYFQYMNLTGESYLLKLGRDGKPLKELKKLPSALILLPSNKCDFKLGKTWEDSIVTFGGTDYPISAIIRDINPDPENMYHGMSVVRKASLTIDTDYSMKEWNNKVFKNGARPSVAIEVPTELSDDSYKRLEQSFNEKHTGAETAFKPILLEGGAKITPFMMSQQDLDFLESKRFTRDEILAMFKVSPSNIGIVEDVNRANAEVQEAEFAKRCIVPRLEQLCDVLNQRLIYPIYGNEFVIGYESPVQDDQDLKLSIAQAGVNKWLSIDEVREMYGFDALPNGKGAEILTPINQVPISDLFVLDEPEQPSNDGGETPQEDNPEEDTPEETPESGKDLGKTQENETVDTVDKAQLRKIIGDAKVKVYTAKSLNYEKMIRRKARKMFNAQKKDVLDWLKTHAKADNHYTKKDWSDDMIDWGKYTDGFTKDLAVIFDMIIEEIGEEAFNQLLQEGSFDPHTESLDEFVKSETYRCALEINSESQKQIKATLAQGMRSGETVQELSARVSAVFGAASTSRAFTIAQTECALAMSIADEGAWEQTGLVEAKEWFTAEDSSVCEFCRQMDGKVVALSGKYFDEGDRISYTDAKGNEHTMKLDYRAIGEPPLHPNCRCVLLPVLKD